MGQVATTNTHTVSDLEALRLQLEEEGKVYENNRSPKEAHDRLLHTLQSNDCRKIITAVVDGDGLADAFAGAGNRGHVDILEAFLNHGMNIDIKDEAGWTALMYASYYDKGECVRLLLDHNASVNIQDKDGMTALMHASHCGSTEIVEMLLEKNANPDNQNKNGWTALMWASPCGFKNIIRLLLDHNADIELKNYLGITALDLTNDEEIKEMIRNHVSTSYVLK